MESNVVFQIVVVGKITLIYPNVLSLVNLSQRRSIFTVLPLVILLILSTLKG